MNIKTTTLLSLVAVTTVVLILITSTDTTDKIETSSAAIDLPAQQEQSAMEADTAYSRHVDAKDVLGFESSLGHLPDSLIGTQLDVRLHTDEAGHLRVSDDLKYIFDFFLSTIDEEDLETILLRIDEYLDHHLDEPALSESKAILVQYINFKESLFDLQEQMGQSLSEAGPEGLGGGEYLDLLRARLDQRNALRDQYLDPEVNQAFFEEEAAYDEYTFSKLKLQSDKSLSEQQRQEQLAALQDQLPEDVRESISETQITETLKTKTQKIIEEGGGEQEVRALRVEMFGEEAAQRFDELDKQRAEWNARIESYLQQRQRILDVEGVVPEELEAQVDALRSSLFDSREQIRVRGIEARG